MGWTEAGILIEILGASWIVLGAWRARNALNAFPEEATYDSLAPTIAALMRIVRTQFSDQLRGFLVLGLGLTLQLHGTA